MLRSVRDLQNARAYSGDALRSGLVKDVYFDDQSWTVKNIVMVLDPRRFGKREVLVAPGKICRIDPDAVFLTVPASEMGQLPLTSSVRPVCRQYASFALGSPGAAMFSRSWGEADPYLRSFKVVGTYRLLLGGQFCGTLADFIVDDITWDIRYLAVEQVIENRKVRLHVLPQSVERFTWATQRIMLREMRPVSLAEEVHFASAA